MCPSLSGPDNHQIARKDIIFFSYCQSFHYFCIEANKIVMDLYFNYDVPSSGKSFIGRKNDVSYLSNMISAGQSVALYGEPHQGRRSLVRQTLTTLQISGKPVSVIEVDLLGSRTNSEMLLRYAACVMKAFGSSLDDHENVMYSYLTDTHLTFDADAFECDSPFLSFTETPDDRDMETVLSLPYFLASDRRAKVLVYFRHFQNAARDDDSGRLLKIFEKVVVNGNMYCSVIFTGDSMNAMKDIFEVKRYFWKDVVIFPLSEIPVAEATEFIFRGFQNKGKVVERSLISEVVRMFRGNMWYLNMLFSITDYVSMGYVTQKSYGEALSLLMSIHRGRFVSQVADLTDFQVRLLKAIIDGETRFSSSAIVSKYELNSSANVKRLKDALIKKEVVWFDEKDEPHIQDPLFEYWLRQEYFAK